MKFIGVTLLIGVLFLLNIFIGSVDIPVSHVVDILLGADGYGAVGFIVRESRVPMAVTALLAGAGLAVSGLMLQTAFPQSAGGSIGAWRQLRGESRGSLGDAAARRDSLGGFVHDRWLCGRDGRGVCRESHDNGGAAVALIGSEKTL